MNFARSALALALTLAPVTLLAEPAQSQPASTPSDQPPPPPTSPEAQQKIRQRLAQLVNDALGSAVFAMNLDKMRDDFSTLDRAIVNPSELLHTDEIDQRLQKFHALWKQEYGHDFHVSPDDLHDLQIRPGPNNLRAVVLLQSLTGPVTNPGGQTTEQGVPLNTPLLNLEDQNANHPWKVVIDQQFDATHIRHAVQTTLDTLIAHQKSWPADEHAAARQVAYDVLFAIRGRQDMQENFARGRTVFEY